jgi:hypothetical protein
MPSLVTCVLGSLFLTSLIPAGRAEDDPAELRKQAIEQQKQIEDLKRRIDEKLSSGPAAPQNANDPPNVAIDGEAVKKIVSDYLKENPGAGMPSGVQTGFEKGRGFVIRSAPNPNYVAWDDDCRIPFELRIRGRLMLSYMNYKVTDRTNHMTNKPATQDSNAVRIADFSQLEAKRVNLIFQGSMFDPDLRYNINLIGSTRGAPGLQNNKVVQTSPTGGADPNTAGISPTGGGILLDHAVSLFECYVAYDFHGCASEKGCGPNCPDGTVKYCPTYTLIGGKLKPFFGLDEFLGNSNQQFVEFSMADIFFDADDDTRLMGAGTQVKAFEDRFFMQALVTNGSEGSFQPNTQMDKYPGFITGFWYDFGGSWNSERRNWDLFGDCISDIDYSCSPVVRAGGCVNLVPMDRRSLYGDAEQSRFFTMPGGIGGTRLINLLNGDLGSPAGSHDVDKFDAYTYNAFLAGKYHGFSICNEWWFRNLNDFRTAPNGMGNIIYQDTLGPGGASANALFPHHGLLDYGTTLQAGYFIIPKRLEVAARWSWIRGQSGDINGNFRFVTVTVPGVAGRVQVVDGAFRNFHEADEYTLGVNYYWKRQLLKWQTDVGIVDGGNPAGSGTAIAGWIAGADGYFIRTQLQLAF